MSNIGQIFSPLNTSVSALRAQRERIDVVSSNLANAETTRTSEGGPYQRKQTVFESVLSDVQAADGASPSVGVRVAATLTDSRPPIKVNMPGHPDADANGDVLMPDISVSEEMVDLMSASRAYEANAAAFKITRAMFQRTLELGRM